MNTIPTCQTNPESVINKHNATNTRLFNRNLPSQTLQPYLDVRPVLTKYSYLPIVDPRKQVDTKLVQMPTYNQSQTFNPGNNAPWSGFSSNVNLESELRNQIFALQKSNQSVYVPSSKSDLYQYSFNLQNTPQSHSLLFEQNNFHDFNPNPNSNIVGSDIFNNSTRTQLKEINQTPDCL